MDKIMETIERHADAFIQRNNGRVQEFYRAYDAGYANRYNTPIGDEYSDEDGGWETVGSIIVNCAKLVWNKAGYYCYPYKSRELRHREATLSKYRVTWNEAQKDALVKSIYNHFSFYAEEYDHFENVGDVDEMNDTIKYLDEAITLRLYEDEIFDGKKLKKDFCDYSPDCYDGYDTRIGDAEAFVEELENIRSYCRDTEERIHFIFSDGEKFSVEPETKDEELRQIVEKKQDKFPVDFRYDWHENIE